MKNKVTQPRENYASKKASFLNPDAKELVPYSVQNYILTPLLRYCIGIGQFVVHSKCDGSSVDMDGLSIRVIMV